MPNQVAGEMQVVLPASAQNHSILEDSLIFELSDTPALRSVDLELSQDGASDWKRLTKALAIKMNGREEDFPVSAAAANQIGLLSANRKND